MPEVKVKKGEQLNGLGQMMKQTMDTNLQDPKIYKRIEKLNASVVIKESSYGVAITLHFRHGQIEIQNDAIDKPTASMEAGFENLAYVSSGQISPTMALLTRKMKARGNLLTLLKISPVTVLRD